MCGMGACGKCSWLNDSLAKAQYYAMGIMPLAHIAVGMSSEALLASSLCFSGMDQATMLYIILLWAGTPS